MDVLIVGAGLSGVGAACHLEANCPGKSYAILEARDAIGGTWDLFRYPGIRSDSDMFTLGYSFRPWREGKAIADGPAIRGYVRDTAREHGVEDRIRFNHRVVRADWSSEESRWAVEAERTETGESVQLTCAHSPGVGMPSEPSCGVTARNARIQPAAGARPLGDAYDPPRLWCS